jgi:hypothetical protein
MEEVDYQGPLVGRGDLQIINPVEERRCQVAYHGAAAFIFAAILGRH